MTWQLINDKVTWCKTVLCSLVCMYVEAKNLAYLLRYKNRAIFSLGTPCSAIWFCYLRGPQNCFLNPECLWYMNQNIILKNIHAKKFVKSKKSFLRDNIFNMGIFLWYFACIKNSMKLIISRVYNQDYELINIFFRLLK